MFLRKWRMTLRQFIVLFLTASLALLPYLYRYTRQSNAYLREQAANELGRQVNFANQTITNYAHNIRNAMVLISSDQQLLDTDATDSIRQLLQNFATSNAVGIRNLYYILPEGEVICSKQTLFDIFGNERIEALSKNPPPGLTWHPTAQTTMGGSSMVCSIAVADARRDVRGVLAAECSYAAVFNELTRQFNASQCALCLFDQNDTLIAFSGASSPIDLEPGRYPYEPRADILQALTALPAGENAYENYLLVKSDRNALNWRVGLICPGNYYTQYDLRSKNFFFSSAFTLMAGLLMICALLTLYTMRPLRRLVGKMRSIQNIQDLDQLPQAGNDEVGQLISSYNSMAATIRRLMEEAREQEEMELKMLRSQIGPHFLYNTLSCIGSLARQGKAREASGAIRSLIKLLSFSFDKANEDAVELWEELEGLDAYVSIQKMRHGPLFDFQVNCPEEYRSCRLPKLVLQPLVENAIFHGLLPSEQEDKRICVAVSGTEAGVRLEIRDNGIGMTAEAAAQLLQKKNTLHDRFSGIGVYNVRRRLELFGAQLTIDSAPGVGTRIYIILPV